jgi:3-demethoxyubiquinol 3-hydroxylase
MKKVIKNCIKQTLIKNYNTNEKKIISEMIRVNHAGEYGANVICKGQLKILKNDETIEQILKEEKSHFEKFDNLITERRVRPTLFQPIWKIGGDLLGIATSLLGRKSAMVCHVAVEEAIIEHYEEQLRELNTMEKGKRDLELKQIIKDCRDDEIHHRDLGLENDAKSANFYSFLHTSIKSVCHVAINISKKF